MFLHLMKSKIHNVTVTDAQLDYVGSITIDENLMDAAGLLPGEKVLVVNNDTGARLETYTIKGKRHSGVICLNGSAAHHFKKGHGAIIMAFGLFDKFEAKTHKPKVIFPHTKNTKWRTPEEVVKAMLSIDILSTPKGFNVEYIEEIALKMAFTPEQIIGFISDLKLNLNFNEDEKSNN